MTNSLILSWSSFILVLLGVVFIDHPNSCSASSRALDFHDVHRMQSGFKVPLKHVDSGKNLTKLQRLQRRIKRGRKRLQMLSRMKLRSSTSSDSHNRLQSPVRAGAGEFLMTLSIGTPAKSFSAILDTGSDLTWTQCEPCKRCYKQPTPIFSPNRSSTFAKVACTGGLCDAMSSSTCRNQSCQYYYSYGDYSSTEGILATETLSFGDVSVPGVSFGCGNDNMGGGFNQGAGIVGLGRGNLSIVSQLKEPIFSYCLTSVDNTKSKSTLLMGSAASLNNKTTPKIITTPLIRNPSEPTFYYLSLEGITVGGTGLSIEKDTFSIRDNGGGGMIIDSGTTLTYLAEDAFDAVVEEFSSQMALEEKDVFDTVGLDLCFQLPQNTTTKVEVPKLVFNFKGADLELPSENYMITDSEAGVICLAIGSASGMSVLGNYQQQNLLVLHDLDKETISFLPTKCDQL